jgi:hypothetical protein
MCAEYFSFRFLLLLCRCIYLVSEFFDAMYDLVDILVVVLIKYYVTTYQVHLYIFLAFFFKIFCHGERTVGTGHSINLPIRCFHDANLHTTCGRTKVIIYTPLHF